MHRLACLALLGLAPFACVTSPDPGVPLPPGTSVIDFRGITPWRPGEQVRIEYLDSTGAPVLLATAPVSRRGEWFATVRTPKAAWWRAPCHQARFRFTTSSGATLVGVDRACVAALPPSPTQAQLDACYPPHLDLVHERVHVGDLALVGQAAADPYACVTELQGNLTADAGRQVAGPGYAQGIAFELPLLRTVTGNVSLDGARAGSLSLPRLEHVGGDLSIVSTQFLAWPVPFVPSDPPTQTTTRFGLDRLSAVGGSLSLTIADDHSLRGSGATPHDFGMPWLRSVGSDLVLHNGVFPAVPLGLPALPAVGRDLVYDWGLTDLDSTAFLAGLRSVGRDAHFTLPPNSRHALYALEAVGRNMTVDAASGPGSPRLGPSFAPALATIAGDLLLDGVGLNSACSATLPALRQVGGALRISGGGPGGALGTTGASHLVLGAIEVAGASLAAVPLHPDAEVAASGPVSFTGNPGLCACQVDAFAAALSAGGWAGALANSGNGAAASCAPCPAATCP